MQKAFGCIGEKVLDQSWLPRFILLLYTIFLLQCPREKFTCGTHGNCIAMSQRCNGQVQCPAANDNSDEENCRILDINNEYNKQFAPKSENNPKVPVHVHVFIKNIFGINELDLSLKMRVQITMEWFDHRLTFRNLRDGQDENIVPQEEVSKLWLPYLIFSDSNLGTFSSLQFKDFLFQSCFHLCIVLLLLISSMLCKG